MANYELQIDIERGGRTYEGIARVSGSSAWPWVDVTCLMTGRTRGTQAGNSGVGITARRLLGELVDDVAGARDFRAPGRLGF